MDGGLGAKANGRTALQPLVLEELLEALKNYQKSDPQPQEISRPLRAMTHPRPSKLVLKEVQPLAAAARPISSTGLPNVARAVSAPSTGHTLYETRKHSKQRSWSTFWFSLLLLGVIGVTGYYVRPYTDDVWAVLQSVFNKPAPSTQPPATVLDAPANSAAPAPVKSKVSKPAVVAPSVKQPDDGNSSTAVEKQNSVDSSLPAGKSISEKPANGASKGADSTSQTVSVPVSDPAASAKTAPPAAPPVPLHVRMLNLKIAIDKRLFDAGLGDRVHATLAGSSLVLQGHLRAEEHQAILTKLRVLPDWAKVTDDILPVQ